MFHKANKDNNMGIHFAKQNRITSSNPLKVTYSLKLVQIALILVGVYGVIYGFLSGFKIEVLNTMIVTAIVLSTIYYFIIFQFPSLLKYTLTATTIVYFIAMYEFLDEIRNGFWNIENYYIHYLNHYYNLQSYPYIVGKYDRATVISIFIIFVIVVITGIVSSAILYNCNGGIYIVVSSVLMILPLTVGLLSDVLPLSLYFIFLVCIIGMSRFTRRYHGSSIRKGHKKQWKLNVVLGNKFRYVIGLKVGIILSVILALLFISIPLLFTKKNYESLNIKDTKVKLQDKLMSFSIEDTTNNLSNDFKQWSPFTPNISYGGLSGGELGKDGNVTFDNKTVLKVEMPVTSDTVYLKGYVGSVYTGDKWENLSEADELIYEDLIKRWSSNFTVGNQSSYFLSLLNKLSTNVYSDLKFCQSSIKVTNVRSNRKFSYAPYNTIFNASEMDVSAPLYVSPNVENEIEYFDYYTNYSDILNFEEGNEFQSCLDYYNETPSINKTLNEEDKDTLNELIKYRANELEYRYFVYSTYTELSDQVPSRLVQDFSGKKYSQSGIKIEGSNLKEYVAIVANYLAKNTTYSLKPGPLPKGKDYIEYFLYENKVGYCAHYASAATVILRIMGIPARYVEGYIVKESNILAGEKVGEVNIKVRGEKNQDNLAINEIDVPDANAHAWVEVYVDGFGWVPVEFSSGYTATTNGVINTEVVNELKPTDIPTPTVPSNEEGNKVTPIVTLVPTKAPATNKNNEKEQDGSNTIKEETVNGKDLSSENKANWVYYAKVFMIIFRIAIIILMVFSIILLRWQYITNKNKRKIKSFNSDKKVMFRYKELLRMISYYGVELNSNKTYQLAAKEIEEKCNLLTAEELERFIEIALKAKFSPNKISEQEDKEIELYYNKCHDSMYNNKSFITRMYLKYIKVFVN